MFLVTFQSVTVTNVVREVIDLKFSCLGASEIFFSLYCEFYCIYYNAELNSLLAVQM